MLSAAGEASQRMADLRKAASPRSSDILWSPSRTIIEEANITRFARQMGMEDASYDVLHRWSVAQPGAFWGGLWDFCHVIGDRGSTVVEVSSDSRMLGTKWFPEARLNFAENLLSGSPEETVVYLSDESGFIRGVTREELRRRTAQFAHALRERGIGQGDCVAGIQPNNLLALVSLLATASLGATWSSCSPDFGVVAILDRLGQIKPKILFADCTYHYAGRDHDIGSRLVEICAGLPGLQALVLTDQSSTLPEPAVVEVVPVNRFTDPDAPALQYARTPFNQPLYVLFTSGTTGAPKAIVHSAGGVLLQHLKEHILHSDVRPGDVMSWYSNTAWMMYHWLVSGLASGAAIVLMDGAAIPKRDGKLELGLLFTVAEQVGVTHFGTSPKYLSTLEEGNYSPGLRHDLGRLRWLLSAGAPVSGAQFDWMYQEIKSDMVFASISGGTEIIGCFLLGNPVLPVRRGQLTCVALGMALNVLDERNAPVIGRKGDLVCTEPFPAMPLTFWGEGGDERYRAAYFSERPGIWTHGDLAELTIYGSGIIYGRTDTTLKPGGVRIGTAEIYAIVETFPEVADLLVFGMAVPGDEEVVLCIVPAEGAEIGSVCAKRIRDTIRERASPRHVPHQIHLVSAIPYTINGKRVESAARSAAAGNIVKNIGALGNPECLPMFAALRRERAL
jgi:acetoacetyl-CoA synthetase